MNVSCEDFLSLVDRTAGADLVRGLPEDAAVHVGSCRDCREQFEQALESLAALRSADDAARATDEAPADLWSGVAARLEPRRDPAPIVRRPRIHWAAAAAMFLLVLVPTALIWTPPETEHTGPVPAVAGGDTRMEQPVAADVGPVFGTVMFGSADAPADEPDDMSDDADDDPEEVSRDDW